MFMNNVYFLFELGWGCELEMARVDFFKYFLMELRQLFASLLIHLIRAESSL